MPLLYLCFPNGVAQTQRGKITCPLAHNSIVVIRQLKLMLSVFRLQPLNHYDMVASFSGLRFFFFFKYSIDSFPLLNYILILIL